MYDYVMRTCPEYEVTVVQALFKEADGTYDSAWPERFTPDALIRLREINTYMFACQQMNNPRDQAIVDFNPAWLRYYGFSDDAKNIMMEVATA